MNDFRSIDHVLSENNFMHVVSNEKSETTKAMFLFIKNVNNGQHLWACIEFGSKSTHGTVEFLKSPDKEGSTNSDPEPKKRWFMELYKGFDHLNEHIVTAVSKFINPDIEPTQETEPASQVATLKKSEYLNFSYNKGTGEVYSTFPDTGFKANLLDFLENNGVKVGNFSFKGLENFVAENNQMDAIFFDSHSGKFLIEALKLFNFTTSKSQAIKQMVDAENYLNLLILRAKATSESADLVTPDFVDSLNKGQVVMAPAETGKDPIYEKNLGSDSEIQKTVLSIIDSDIKKVEIQPDEFDGIDELL